MFTRPKKSRKGFTVAELLIVLFVMGMLMAALAVAFHASVNNFNENEDIYKAMNTARQALLRITGELRCAIVNHDEPNNQCSMVTTDGRDITYQYNSDDNTLYLIVNSGPTTGTFKMCENVTAMTFDRTTRTDDPTAVRNVQISMTVTVGDNPRTLATAAVVRRNI